MGNCITSQKNIYTFLIQNICNNIQSIMIVSKTIREIADELSDGKIDNKQKFNDNMELLQHHLLVIKNIATYYIDEKEKQ